MTYTVIARCGHTGQLGIGIATYSLAVGGYCPAIRGGLGAVSTQAFVNLKLGNLALRLMDLGYSPDKVMSELAADDPQFSYRQVGIVNAENETVVHTGSNTRSWSGHLAGAGYIANEFAGIFNELGSKVTLINRSDVILRQYDHQIRDRLLQISMMKGIDYKFHAEFQGIEKTSAGCLKVSVSNHEDIEVDCVMFATGRVPLTKGLGLEHAGVKMDDKGAVIVDEWSKTNVDSIYAVGEVTNRMQLTPVASREGQAFADTIFGDNPHQVDYENVPSAVFSHPPMAGVGMTESQAKETLGSVKIYTSDFRAMKNVLANRNERGLYKMICNGETGQIVGLHMIGPEAPEILQAAAIAVKAGLTKQAFDDTVALHPSMAEELVLMK